MYIYQLGRAAGSIWATIKKPSELESARTKLDFVAEDAPAAPSISGVVTKNYKTTSNIAATPTYDTIYIPDLSKNDYVKVYDAATAGNIIAAGSANGTTNIINVLDFGSTGGNVYITVTKAGQTESARSVAVVVAAESDTP